MSVFIENVTIMLRHKIGDMQEIAKKRGGECLSDIYVNTRKKLKWKCNKSHEWEAVPNSIIGGCWCPTCSGNIKSTIKEMQEIAKERGGECLNEVYVNNHKKLKWKCDKNHEWEASPNKIKSGCWCPTCAHAPSLTIEEMREIAKKHGGECLSEAYISNNIKLRWKCNKNHIWEAKPGAVKFGTWCLECYKLSIEEMQEIAKKRGGECLSENYTNNKTKLLWKCDNNHKWWAKPNDIKNGSWCPICRESNGEKTIRLFLEKNNVNFIQQKVFFNCKGIKNSLPFDFYLSDYNIIIEYDGIQHHIPIDFFGGAKSFMNLKKNDQIKNEYCQLNNIKLIRISYLDKDIKTILKLALNIK